MEPNYKHKSPNNASINAILRLASMPNTAIEIQFNDSTPNIFGRFRYVTYGFEQKYYSNTVPVIKCPAHTKLVIKEPTCKKPTVVALKNVSRILIHVQEEITTN